MITSTILLAAFSWAQAYWLIILVALIAGGVGFYRTRGWWFWPGLIVWILLIIIGLALFGSPFPNAG